MYSRFGRWCFNAFGQGQGQFWYSEKDRGLERNVGPTRALAKFLFIFLYEPRDKMGSENILCLAAEKIIGELWCFVRI